MQLAGTQRGRAADGVEGNSSGRGGYGRGGGGGNIGHGPITGPTIGHGPINGGCGGGDGGDSGGIGGNAVYPFEFHLGCGALPEALETSIRLMIPGEVARVTVSDVHHARYG